MSEMDLVGIHAKLLRADQQIQKILDEADTLRMKVKQGIVRDVCDDDEQVWIYRNETPNVPVSWSILIGEILYNMRSALDHLVWQLVLNNEQTPGRNNEFPIAKSYQHGQKEKNQNPKRRQSKIPSDDRLSATVYQRDRSSIRCIEAQIA